MTDSQKTIIDGYLFEKIVVNGANNLQANVKIVNDLNVFPIPDGDTGENMFMTISGGVDYLRRTESAFVCDKSKALAEGMLLNARGNSGVILSQLFDGLAKGLQNKKEVDLQDFCLALSQGVKQAYSSVAKPVEGTMLTVARESTEHLAQLVTKVFTLKEFFELFVEEIQKSLERTPELLAVLKEAGVIDSGGAGLYYIVDGMKNAVEGFLLEDSLAVTSVEKTIDFSKFNQDSVMEYGYCTECMLQLQTCKTDVEAFDVKVVNEFLNSIGDSIVAFKTGSVIKIHVHTLTPYKVLEFCHQFGEFLTVKIENMSLQHNEVVANKTVDQGIEKLMPTTKKEHKKFALVTVATGKGLRDTFIDCGADVVIDGGQGKNPSIETFLNAFDSLDAEHIFVLPNNGNIVMAAKQAGAMHKDAQVHVVETKNFGQAYSILSMLDYSADDADVIVQNMQNDMQESVTGMVTPCIRDAVIDGVTVYDKQYIGFTDKQMLVCEKDKLSTLFAMLKKLNAQEKNFIINVFGACITDQEKQEISEMMQEKYSGIEYYEIDGGQDVYDFIVIME